MNIEPLKPGATEEIHIIPYSHHDFAWTNSRLWHVSRYLKCFNEVLDLMEADENFTFLIDNAAHSLVPFLKYCPERVSEFKARIEEGRIAVANGGYCLARPNYVGEETFVRNMAEGWAFMQKTSGAAGIDVFINADTGCGHSQLPQTLALGGHRYYRFMRPQGALDCRGVPRQFVWEGLDGSRITVSRGDYVGFRNGGYTNGDFKNRWEEIREEFIEQEFDGSPSAGVAWLSCGGDDSRPARNVHDEPVRILEFVAEWNRRENVRMFFSAPEEYFVKLEARELPVWRGVLDPCELSYNAPIRADRSMWRMRKELDRLIVKAEAVSAVASLTGSEYPEQKLRDFWASLFEIAGHAIEWSLKEDFERLHSIAAAACVSAGMLIREKYDEITGRVKPAEGTRQAVFNVLPWRRKEAVRLHVTDAGGVRGFDLVDSCGNAVEYQVLQSYQGDKWYSGYGHNSVDILAEVAVPPMGYAVLGVRENGKSLFMKPQLEKTGDSPANGLCPCGGRAAIDNGVVTVSLEEGGIYSVVDNSTGDTVFSREGGRVMGCLAFRRTKPSKTWLSSWETVQYFSSAAESWRLVEGGPLRWVYRVTGSLSSSRFTLDIVVRRGERAVGFELELENSGEEGYFVCEFSSDPGTALHADIPFGVEKRDLAQECYDNGDECSCEGISIERGWPGQFYAKSWALFEGRGRPLAVVSQDCSIYYRHDTDRNMISLLLMRCMPLSGKEESWLLQTHPSIEGKGLQHFKFSLFIPEPGGEYSGIVRYSMERAQPLDAQPILPAGSAACLEPRLSLVDTDRGNIIATAFYRQHGSFILRMYETDGKPTRAAIQLGFGFSLARPVDFLGNAVDDPGLSVDLPGRKVTVDFRPWQIVTLQIDV